MEAKTKDYLTPIPYDNRLDNSLLEIEKYIADTKNWSYEKVEPPYIYELGKSNKIRYFGTSHVFSLDDPMVEALREDFHAFAKTHTTLEVLVENWEVEDFADEWSACEKWGERGLIMYWATKLGISVSPTDYDFTICEHIRILAKRLKYEDIVMFIFLYCVKARKFEKWTDEPDLTELSIEKVNKNLTCAGLPPTTLQDLEIAHKTLFGQTIKERKSVLAWEDLDVNKPDNGANTVFKEYHMLRDRNFLYQIISNYALGKNVYCVYGCDHAQFHEPILKDLVKMRIY